MREQIEKIIREAGKILMEHFGKVSVGRDKLFKGDIESEADHAAECHIVENIQKMFPNTPILAEEHPDAYMLGQKALDAGKKQLWVIDALDGSRNFIRGISIFGVSMAFIKNNVPELGMVYLPVANELFWAERGKGAFLNNSIIRVSVEEELDHAMLAGFFYSARPKPSDSGEILRRMDEHCLWRMNSGSAVADAAYAACGRFDAGLWSGLYQWDIAACGLILQEAGAKVTDLKGNPWYWGSDPQDIVVANSVLHKKIMREIVHII